MNQRDRKILPTLIIVLGFVLPLFLAQVTTPEKWIGNKVSGFQNPAIENLDLNGNDIIVDADGDSWIDGGIDDKPRFYTGNALRFSLDSTGFYTGGGARISTATASATVPNLIPLYTDLNTGFSRAAEDQPCVTGGGLEAFRAIPKADTDSDDGDVFLTGISGFHGFVLVRSITDDTSAMYRVSNTTVSDIGLDGDHTSTKDTANHYNFYYETDQFKLQNLVDDDKSVSVVFWVLPT